MGEMADFCEDEWDFGYSEYTYDVPRTCKYCGASPLWWSETPQGWRLLHENDEVHLCPQYGYKNEFEEQ